MNPLFSPQPKPRHWYPAVPCCPFCQRATLPRSDHATGVCTSCAAKPGVAHRLEPVPAALRAKGFQLFLDRPFRWLALQMGKSHVRGLPQALRAAEPHRVMHILLTRFWGDEDTELTYDVLSTLHPDVWAQVGDEDGGGMESPDESEVLRERRERRSLYVRIWRSKFNSRVAKPLLTWLSEAGIDLADRSIAREKKTTTMGGWQVALVLDAMGVKRKPTYWSLVLSHPMKEGMSIVCTGQGCALPTHITVLDEDVVVVESAYNGQVLYSVLNESSPV
jgi:hypothetical protein